jgi:hypothetical protein
MTDALTLPVWPPAGNIFFNRAAQTFNAWMSLVRSDTFAIAMVTQAEFESAFTWYAVGDHDQAFNFYQWHWNPRGISILANTGIDVRKEQSIKRIVDAAWWELNAVEKKARDTIAAATTSYDASVAACVLFEGAGALNAAARRGLGANRWALWFADNSAFVAANPAQ